MNESELNETLTESLNTICSNLKSILSQTEKVLSFEREKYVQVSSICEPWPVKKRKSIESIPKLECTCPIEEINENSNKTNDFVDDIPSIVNKTKALRVNASKNNITKYSDAKNSIKNAISVYGKPTNKGKSQKKVGTRVSKTSITKSTATLSSTSKNFDDNLHHPSCSLFGNSFNDDVSTSQSFTSISEGLSAYGVPKLLDRTLRDYYKFILEDDFSNSITKKAKNIFVKNLNQENELTWCQTIKTLDKLPKYMSALCTIEEKTAIPLPLPCIVYRNVEDLATLEKHKSELYEKELWSDILLYIRNDFIPILNQMKLTDLQKIYICKIIKSVCNFSRSRTPNVPIFRIN